MSDSFEEDKRKDSFQEDSFEPDEKHSEAAPLRASAAAPRAAAYHEPGWVGIADKVAGPVADMLNGASAGAGREIYSRYKQLRGGDYGKAQQEWDSMMGGLNKSAGMDEKAGSLFHPSTWNGPMAYELLGGALTGGAESLAKKGLQKMGALATEEAAPAVARGLQRVVSGVKEGAKAGGAYGAVSGYSGSSGSAGNRLAETAMGAGTGALVGGALHGAASSIPEVANYGANKTVSSILKPTAKDAIALHESGKLPLGSDTGPITDFIRNNELVGRSAVDTYSKLDSALEGTLGQNVDNAHSYLQDAHNATGKAGIDLSELESRLNDEHVRPGTAGASERAGTVKAIMNEVRGLPGAGAGQLDPMQGLDAKRWMQKKAGFKDTLDAQRPGYAAGQGIVKDMILKKAMENDPAMADRISKANGDFSLANTAKDILKMQAGAEDVSPTQKPPMSITQAPIVALKAIAPSKYTVYKYLDMLSQAGAPSRTPLHEIPRANGPAAARPMAGLRSPGVGAPNFQSQGTPPPPRSSWPNATGSVPNSNPTGPGPRPISPAPGYGPSPTGQYPLLGEAPLPMTDMTREFGPPKTLHLEKHLTDMLADPSQHQPSGTSYPAFIGSGASPKEVASHVEDAANRYLRDVDLRTPDWRTLGEDQLRDLRPAESGQSPEQTRLSRPLRSKSDTGASSSSFSSTGPSKDPKKQP